MTPDLSRRALLGAGGLAAGALGLAATTSGQARAEAKPAPASAYYLRNVKLETGYEREGDEVIATRTELKTLKIDKGVIAAILPAGQAIPPGATVYDAGGLLMLPSFRDMHIHLDKTFYGGPWRAPRKRKGGIAGQIQLEHTLLPQMLPTLEPRAEALVALLQGNGTTFARSQCNVDKVVGTQHVEKLRAALERHNADFGHEIVAFPQHGLVSIGLEQTMRQAIRAGATHVGGIDPTAVDGGMEKSVDTMMQIALDEKAGVDIHIHEPGESGVAAINRITDITAKNPVLKDRVTISHAFSLMSLDKGAAADMAQRLNAAGVSIASTVPFGGRVMPIPTLQAAGVKVFTGTDSVVDHWVRVRQRRRTGKGQAGLPALRLVRRAEPRPGPEDPDGRDHAAVAVRRTAVAQGRRPGRLRAGRRRLFGRDRGAAAQAPDGAAPRRLGGRPIPEAGLAQEGVATSRRHSSSQRKLAALSVEPLPSQRAVLG
ncbi:amidohydrolase family protein [Caulobacter sp. RHG1]|uniref:amidohydrolase family protein n=1 Tax=Caulobacter sp. (strain RHG1) TaxID=2545762 RepID=UPI0019D565A0|nr:amidohydrolase family protein [Caulobacter sp. RHG1]